MAKTDDPRADRPARLATVSQAIPLGETLVIGTMGAPGDWRALLRYPTGTVRTVANGDALLGGRVVRVDQTGLEILRAGRRERLGLVATDSMVASPRPAPRPEADAPRRPEPRPEMPAARRPEPRRMAAAPAAGTAAWPG